MVNDHRNYRENLKRRIYNLVLEVLKLLESIPHTPANANIFDQLRRSITSILGNFVEAQYAYSKKEFASYLQISLRSTKESVMWVCLLRDLNKISKPTSEKLLKELDELSRIFTSSLKTIKRRKEAV
jgi:four helix bundle protein